MRRVHHGRNFLLTLSIIGAIVLMSGLLPNVLVSRHTALAAPLAQTDFFWTPNIGNFTGASGTVPGGQITFSSTLSNPGPTGAFNITATPPAGWTLPSINPSSSVSINQNASVGFNFIINIPTNAAPGRYTVTIVAERQSNGATSNATVTIDVANPTVTPTLTTTPTLTASAVPSTTPTPTPGPVCRNGSEPQNEPGNDIGSARLLLVDTLESHGICALGDVDWFKFGGVVGKIYTIDIPRMDNGLDLVIEVYDPDGNPVTLNDDFYNRNGTPVPSDIKPQIKSFRALRNGFYYILVRDSAGLGGNNLTYDIIIRSESFGPTPTLIPELCNDQFEPDGLPENSNEIVPNSVQFAHVLCPRGDADWVKFFGKAGKIYYVYTDTRNYKGPLNDPTEPGADTVMYLADRDGVTLIMMSDDIANSLDSQIRFTPAVDGYYYVQVKNIGDIGYQFIRYDVALKLCVPNRECARDDQPSVPGGSGTGGSGTGGGTTPTDPVFDQTPTVSATSATTPTTTAGGREMAMVNGRVDGFVHPSFERVWARADRPIAEQRTARSWLWGPGSLMARAENYAEAGSGLRQVEYFDKARMEINQPNGDRNSPWYVTTGLLVVELVSGQMQVGNTAFVPRGPANVTVASDPNDSNAPTYASFGEVTGAPAADRTGAVVMETINRVGRVGTYSGPQRSETRLSYFARETGHNIPEVFWEFLNTRGTVYDGARYRTDTLVDWVFTLGYPISEPYWTRAKVGGVDRDVLVQLFQRRVLTYTPDNSAGWQVEMGNVGRHYYTWRYNQNLPER